MAAKSVRLYALVFVVILGSTSLFRFAQDHPAFDLSEPSKPITRTFLETKGFAVIFHPRGEDVHRVEVLAQDSERFVDPLDVNVLLWCFHSSVTSRHTAPAIPLSPA